MNFRYILFTLIGTILGFSLTGDFGGCIIGMMFGALLCFLYREIFIYGNEKKISQRNEPEDFMILLLTLSASVIRVDGKVEESELDYVRNYFKRQFGDFKMTEYMITLRNLMLRTFDLQEICNKANQHMNLAYKLQLIHYLFGVACADGYIKDTEINKINVIAYYLKVSEADFNSIKAMFMKTNDSAYVMLEVSKDASIAEIKKAYKQMALKYHPDKVYHLGEDVQKAAHEKFREIMEAYEQIKKEKCFN